MSAEGDRSVDPTRGTHPGARERLERAAAAGRLHSSLLFHGPPGSGREATARWLAARIICPGDSAPCGACVHCSRVLRDMHPDFAVRRPESRSRRIVIDDVRSLQEEIAFRPFEAERRLFLVVEADRMTESAANAFLKTLEEPPAAAVLVLTAPSPEALLPTVRSRCQPVAFSLLPPETLAEEVAGRREDLGVDGARKALRLLGGDPQQAVEQPVEEVLEDRDALLDLLEGWVAADRETTPILEFIEARHRTPKRDDAGRRQEPDRLLRSLTVLRTLGRDLLHAAGGGATAAGSSGEETRLRRLAARIGPGGAAEILARVEEARRSIDRGANRRLAGEDLLISLQDSLRGSG